VLLDLLARCRGDVCSVLVVFRLTQLAITQNTVTRLVVVNMAMAVVTDTAMNGKLSTSLLPSVDISDEPKTYH